MTADGTAPCAAIQAQHRVPQVEKHQRLQNEAKEQTMAGNPSRTCRGKSFSVREGTRDFMADFAFDRFHEHPYSKNSPDTHDHFAPTRLHYPHMPLPLCHFVGLCGKELEETLRNGIHLRSSTSVASRTSV